MKFPIRVELNLVECCHLVWDEKEVESPQKSGGWRVSIYLVWVARNNSINIENTSQGRGFIDNQFELRRLRWDEISRDCFRRAHKTSFMLFKSNKNKHNLIKLPGLDIFYLEQGEGRYYNSISYWKLYSLAKESRKLKNRKYFLFIFRIFVFSIII